MLAPTTCFLVCAAVALTTAGTVQTQNPSGSPPQAPAAAASAGQGQAPRKPRTYRVVQPTVFPGAKVPFPTLEAFVQGTPRADWVPGKTFVFEFFSTTCGHCAEAAPVVDALARQYAPLGWEFIGVTSDDEATTRAWLEAPEHKEFASYSIACDTDRSAQRDLQDGTFQNLSPRCFVVRDGIVLWYGHPDIAEKPLAAIAAGTWSIEEERPAFVRDAIIARAKKQTGNLATECEKNGKWQELFDLLDSIAAALPDQASTFELQKFGTMIGPADMPVEGYALGKQLALRYAKDIASLRTLARTTLNAPKVQVRDLDFAFAVARAADNLGKGEDARASEVLALAYFSRGDREKAIELQTRAIAQQTNAKLRRNYEQQLEKYRTQDPKPVPSQPLSQPSKPTPPTGDPHETGM